MSFPFGVGSQVGSFFLQLNTFPFSMSQFLAKNDLHFCLQQNKVRKNVTEKSLFIL